MKIDINSIFSILQSNFKKKITDNINVRESCDSISDKILDLVLTLKPKECNHGQYVILLLSIFSQILAGFKATALNENIVTSKSLEELDKIHQEMIGFIQNEMKKE